MDIQKVASTGTAAVVLGTGAFVGGNHQNVNSNLGRPHRASLATSFLSTPKHKR